MEFIRHVISVIHVDQDLLVCMQHASARASVCMCVWTNGVGKSRNLATKVHVFGYQCTQKCDIALRAICLKSFGPRSGITQPISPTSSPTHK